MHNAFKHVGKFTQSKCIPLEVTKHSSGQLHDIRRVFDQFFGTSDNIHTCDMSGIRFSLLTTDCSESGHLYEALTTATGKTISILKPIVFSPLFEVIIRPIFIPLTQVIMVYSLYAVLPG